MVRLSIWRDTIFIFIRGKSANKNDLKIGAKIQGQQFGVANTSELVWFGIMGLARGWGAGSLSYPLVVDSLAAQGFTNTKLFSVDLGKQVNPGGETTFKRLVDCY